MRLVQLIVDPEEWPRIGGWDVGWFSGLLCWLSGLCCSQNKKVELPLFRERIDT